MFDYLAAIKIRYDRLKEQLDEVEKVENKAFQMYLNDIPSFHATMFVPSQIKIQLQAKVSVLRQILEESGQI